jgi:hypothetical protein
MLYQDRLKNEIRGKEHSPKVTTWWCFSRTTQDLLVSANGSPAVTVPVYYTFGWWIQSQPIALKLTAVRKTPLLRHFYT